MDIAESASIDEEEKSLSGRFLCKEPVRYWSDEEHLLFLRGVQKYGGRNYRAIAEMIKTRTPTQVRTHLQKYLLKLQKIKRLKEEAESINEQFGKGMKQECWSALGISTSALNADPVLSAAAGLNQEKIAENQNTAKYQKETDLDSSHLVGTFEKLVNEHRVNEYSHGMNKNCHFCGHEPKRFCTVGCCIPSCGQRYCEHCLVKHLPHVEIPSCESSKWICPICRKICCCVTECCNRQHRHCKRYRRTKWKNGGHEENSLKEGEVWNPATKHKHDRRTTEVVKEEEVGLFLDFCKATSVQTMQ